MLLPIVEADGSLFISNVLGKKVYQLETEAGSLFSFFPFLFVSRQDTKRRNDAKSLWLLHFIFAGFA
jgi:hypothetical protein